MTQAELIRDLVEKLLSERDKNNNETTVTNNYTYDSFGKLLNIQHGNTNYAFTYNNFGGLFHFQRSADY